MDYEQRKTTSGNKVENNGKTDEVIKCFVKDVREHSVTLPEPEISRMIMLTHLRNRGSAEQMARRNVKQKYIVLMQEAQGRMRDQTKWTQKIIPEKADFLYLKRGRRNEGFWGTMWNSKVGNDDDIRHNEYLEDFVPVYEVHDIFSSEAEFGKTVSCLPNERRLAMMESLLLFVLCMDPLSQKIHKSGG
ncbi:unnamed protein product [Thelazia callipaeda]|uniref:NR LBD domain-containing protein n=1 Tax=Thelazia callipaeda TaxID=103827 RepID=A0A0N5D410_THECL|nr:unnamed protein product [Thelazia callipaeda]